MRVGTYTFSVACSTTGMPLPLFQIFMRFSVLVSSDLCYIFRFYVYKAVVCMCGVCYIHEGVMRTI